MTWEKEIEEGNRRGQTFGGQVPPALSSWLYSLVLGGTVETFQREVQKVSWGPWESGWGVGRKSLTARGRGGERFVLERVRSEKWDPARGFEVDLL